MHEEEFSPRLEHQRPAVGAFADGETLKLSEMLLVGHERSLCVSFFAELLHRREQILAIAVAIQIDAAALVTFPLRSFNELPLLGNIVAESRCGTTRIQADAHE